MDNVQDLIERLRHSAERLGARRTGQLSATANYGNAGRGHCDPCLEPAIAACNEAAAALESLTRPADDVVGAREDVLREALMEFAWRTGDGEYAVDLDDAVQSFATIKQSDAVAAERERLDAIAEMMGEFVDNWPEPKRFDTALELVAKTIRILLDPPKHRYWGAGEADCPREIKAGNGELHTLRCKVCGEDNPRDQRCLVEAAIRGSAT